MNVDLTDLMNIQLKENIDKNIDKANKNREMKEQMNNKLSKADKNREMKEQMKDKISKAELKIMKEGKEIKNINEIKDINYKSKKGIVKEIDNKTYILESSFDIDNLPKISEGIINKDVIKDVPGNLKRYVPAGFNFNELDQKFSNFI